MESATEDPSTTKQDIDYVLHGAAVEFLATDELEQTAKLISSVLPSPENQDNEARINRARLYRFCAANFPSSLSLKLLRVYASKEPRFKENVREIAIRRLDALLSDHRQGIEPMLDFFALKEIAALLISCLKEKGIREDTFKILAQVTYHVAFEILVCHNTVWRDLREFISSRAETEFNKAIYIFKSFSIMPSDGDEFMLPCLEDLIPPILRWLQPSQLCRENNWALAFAGAFFVAIHLIGTTHAGMIDYIVEEMLKSATELVNTGMEVGFVRRGVREVEMLVRKELEWFCESEYEFVSSLIGKMNAIKGMRKETKMVLCRIQIALKIQKVKEKAKKKLRAPDSSRVSKARPVFMIPSGKEAATLVSKLLVKLVSQENQSVKAFYRFCWEYLPNGLAEMIFKVYQCSTDAPVIRSKSIILLSALLSHFRDNNLTLSRSALRKIKPLLISSLFMPVSRDTDIKILAKIVSLVASEVFESDRNGWEELCVCIVWVADDDLGKALHLFNELPPLYESFLLTIVKRLFPEILTLLEPKHGNAKDWILTLQAGFKMAIQLLETARSDLAGDILYAVLMSANKLVRQQSQDILRQGLQELRWMVKHNQYMYDKDQLKFALDLASMMARMTGVERQTKAASREIYQILRTKKS